MMSGKEQSDLKEIAFYLDDQADTSASVEFLWCEALDDGTFRVASIPYHPVGVALGDIIEVAENEELHFVRVREPSGHSALRVFLEPGVDPQRLFESLRKLGSQDVPTEQEGLFALDVPPSVSITEVLDVLSEGQDAGDCDWSVGFIATGHGAALRDVMDADSLPDWLPRA